MIRRLVLLSWLLFPAIARAADPPFTFVIVPDPQNMVMSSGTVWTSLCQWVVNNRVSENIQAVFTVGDLVNNPTTVQFTTSLVGLGLIEATGIPVLPIVGNHDYDVSGNPNVSDPANRALTKFDQYYGPAHFTGKTWYRGNLNGSNANYYVTFDVGTRKFLVVVLEFYPRPGAVTWASDIIDANSDRETIVLTHSFLFSNGNRIQDATWHGPNEYGLPTADASGEDLWNSLLKKKSNVRAVFSGHVSNGPHTAHRTDFGDRGNPVHQIFNDYQSAANGGDGWIGLLTFNPTQKTVEMRYYRTWAPSGLGLDPNTPAFTLAWRVDMERPVVAITSPANNATVSGLVTVSATATDNVGVTSVKLFVDGVLSSTDTTTPYTFPFDSALLTDGPHTLMVRAFDADINFSSHTITVNVQNADIVRPIVAITSPANDATVSGLVTVSATATDNVRVAFVKLFVDGVLSSTDTTTPYTFPFDSALLTNGPHTLMVRAFDTAINFSTHTITVNVQNADMVRPIVAITFPANNATVSGLVTVSATATDNVRVAFVKLFVDGVLSSTDTATPYTFPFNSVLRTNGPHTLMVRAVDTAINFSTHTITVNVQNNDSTPPTVSITAPAAGSNVVEPVAIKATATDAGGIKKVEFYADNVLLGLDRTPPYQFVWTPNGAPRQVNIRVTAYDFQNNVRSNSIDVFVGTIVAAPMPLGGTHDGATLDRPTVLTASPSGVSVVNAVEFLVDGVLVATDNQAPFEHLIDPLSLTEGDHELSIRYVDQAGTPGYNLLFVDVSHTAREINPPFFGHSSIADGTVLVGLVTLEIDAFDDVAIDTVELFVDGQRLGGDGESPYAFDWDTTSSSPGRHHIQFLATDMEGNVTTVEYEVVVEIPAAPATITAFNPLFNPARSETLSIPLDLAVASHVRARVIDRLGVEIVEIFNGDVPASSSLSWNGRNHSGKMVASGTYLLWIEIDGNTQTRKIIVRK